MADVAVEVHTALLAKLNELCTVPVYDAVPRDSSYPFVELDAQQFDDAGFMAGDVKERTVYLSVWSEARGQAEAMQILKEISAIDQQTLALAAGSCVSVRMLRADTNRDADGVTYMGSATLRIITID